MRMTAIGIATFLACAVLPVAGSLSAMSASADLTAILDVCEATSLDEAANRGEQLGWPKAPEDRDWRAGFERHNGGPVQVVGWRRIEREGDGLLSYWVASGRHPHTACSFSTDQPGLLEALRDRFGTPDTFEEHDDIVSAFWKRGEAEISLTRVGASSSLNISRRG